MKKESTHNFAPVGGRMKGKVKMKYLSCKSGAMSDSTTIYTVVLKNCILIIKNVPCVKCEQCGDELFNTDVLEKIDGIIVAAEKMASEVSIIDYSRVA